MSFNRPDPSTTLPVRSKTGYIANPAMRNRPATCSPSVVAERARMLLGCYRTGEATDPEIYVGAIATILANYPEDIVRSVTDPATGIPGKIKWLPAVAEVRHACEELMKPQRDAADRERRRREAALLLAPHSAATPEERERAVAKYEAERNALLGKLDAQETIRTADEKLAALARDGLARKPLTIGPDLAKKLDAMKAAP